MLQSLHVGYNVVVTEMDCSHGAAYNEQVSQCTPSGDTKGQGRNLIYDCPVPSILPKAQSRFMATSL